MYNGAKKEKSLNTVLRISYVYEGVHTLHGTAKWNSIVSEILLSMLTIVNYMEVWV
jgi:hypothetical protein